MTTVLLVSNLPEVKRIVIRSVSVTHHSTAQFLPGSTISNRYLVEGVLGAGAFGTVYEVYDIETSSDAAIKVLNEHLHTEDRARKMMLREGKILQKLEHPNVVKCYGAWEEEDGAIYIVTELLRGETLASYFKKQKELDPVFVLTVAEQLADALAHLHERGVVHRDIKPENIFIEQRLGRAWPVIVDFGLSFVEGSKTLGMLPLNERGVTGTPLYMSPEQITNQDLCTATDIYSLGSVLYEMLTGKAPYEEAGLSVVETMKRKIVADPEAFFIDWDEGALDTLVAWMLARYPEERVVAPAVAEVLRAHDLHPAKHSPYGWHTTRATPVGRLDAVGRLSFRAS